LTFRIQRNAGAWPKKFGISLIELEGMIGKVGNSVSALTKEVHIRQSTVPSISEQPQPTGAIPTEG
jgi:hypothetical protein